MVKSAELKDLDMIKALGAGGFGLVKLVRVKARFKSNTLKLKYFVIIFLNRTKGITDRAFALKCIQKCRVVQYGQQRHIMDEKNILLTMQSPFILGLLRTFKGKTKT